MKLKAILVTTLLMGVATQSLSQEVTGNTALGDSGSFNNQEHGASYNSVGGDNITGTVEHSTTSTTHVNNTNGRAANGFVTAVPLTATNGTCLGSQGGGISAAGIGISTGKTVVDEDCNNRLNEAHKTNQLIQKTKLLESLGLQAAAISVSCQDLSIRIALKAALEPDVYNKLCKKYER